MEKFISGLARTRKFVIRRVADGRDVLTGYRACNQAVAGELVGLLAVFPAALTITLSGEAAAKRIGAAHLARGQGQVDKGQDVGYSLGLLFREGSGEDHRHTGPPEQARRLQQFGFGDACDALHTFRPIGGGNLSTRSKPSVRSRI